SAQPRTLNGARDALRAAARVDRPRLRARALGRQDREVRRSQPRPRARRTGLRLDSGRGRRVVSAALLEQRFEAQRDRLPDSAEITRLRREAFASFAAKGFPTRRDESWHYTDLKPIATGDFD